MKDFIEVKELNGTKTLIRKDCILFIDSYLNNNGYLVGYTIHLAKYDFRPTITIREEEYNKLVKELE